MESVHPLLKQLEKTREQFWNITPEVGQFLHDYILKHNYKTILEIGTSNGYSAIWLASALKKTGGHLYTIESNLKKRYPLALENIKKSGLEDFVTPILGHAPEAIPKQPESFEMAFFDATKYEHIDYFNTLESRIPIGGTIITDNIDSHRQVFQPYLEKIHQLKNWQSHEKNLGTGLLISQKIS